MNFRHLAYILLFVAVLFTSAWTVMKSSVATMKSDEQTLLSEVFWKEQIETHGAEEAYRELSRMSQKYDLSIMHRMAHFFGAALYHEEGIPGYSVCDDQFLYGCSHDFVGRAISEHGESIIGELYNSCTARTPYVYCQHGMGHGIISSFGYDLNSLQQSLDACDKVASSKNHNPGGCHRGVFMEYNLRSILGTPFKLREVSDGNWYEPCNKFSGSVRGSCIFYLPQWWWYTKTIDTNDNRQIFVQMGTLCDGLPPRDHSACYGGVGKIAVQSSSYFKPDGPSVLCESTSPDTQKRFWCKSIAAFYLVVAGGFSEADASTMCAGVAGDSRAECLLFASGNTQLFEQWIDAISR